MVYRYTSALGMALGMYEEGSRQSGRTTRMLDMIKPGDRIVMCHEEYGYLRGCLTDRNISPMDVHLVQARTDGMFPELLPIAGTTHFTHFWQFRRTQYMLQDYEDAFRIYHQRLREPRERTPAECGLKVEVTGTRDMRDADAIGAAVGRTVRQATEDAFTDGE